MALTWLVVVVCPFRGLRSLRQILAVLLVIAVLIQHYVDLYILNEENAAEMALV